MSPRRFLLFAENFVCQKKGCNWPDYKEGVDWGYYSKTDGSCTKCQKTCSMDKACGSLECGNGYCSWWKVGKCSSKSEQTSDYYTCRKS